MFGVWLKHWRAVRGVSQLDLAHAAAVSARHLSFLETGRSRPTEGMVLRLADALGLPLREQNRLLEAAGFAPLFPEQVNLPDVVSDVLDRMADQHEPYPLLVLDTGYHVLRLNRGAQRLFGQIPGERPNLLGWLIDPAGLRPRIVDWDQVVEWILRRLERELAVADEAERRAWVERVRAELPIPADPTTAVLPALPLRLRTGDRVLSFLSALTTFSAPREAAVQEVVIESLFPLDPVTREWCAATAG